MTAGAAALSPVAPASPTPPSGPVPTAPPAQAPAPPASRAPLAPRPQSAPAQAAAPSTPAKTEPAAPVVHTVDEIAHQLATPPPTELGDIWKASLAAASGNRRLRVLMDDLALESLNEGVAVIRAPEAIKGLAYAAAGDLAGVLTQIRRAPTRVEIVLQAREAVPEAPAPARISGAEHPLVKKAITLLGARVVSVQPRKTAPKSEGT